MTEPRDPTGTVARPQSQDPEQGTALVWALMFMVISTGMIVAHTSYLASSRKDRDARYDRTAISTTFADSGLQDALSWFHRQAVQPVAKFEPVLNLAADPPVIDTMDPSIGIMREFNVHGNLWCRYEVRTDDAVDITAQRDPTLAPGSAWEVIARSYVYRVNDGSKAFDQAPNTLLATSSIETEIRGIAVAPPAQGGVIINDRNKLIVSPDGILDGGPGRPYVTTVNAAVVTPIPGIDPLASVQGTLPPMILATLDTSPKRMFGMELPELRSFSDSVVASDRVPKNARNKIVFISEDAILPGGSHYEGVLLVVNGNLEISDPIPSLIQGTLFVSGQLRVASPGTEILGTVVTNELRLEQGAIRYDPTHVAAVAGEAQRYRPRRGRRLGH